MAMRPYVVAGLAAAGLALANASPVEIHPAGPTVPENLLRIELRFDQPQQLPFDLGRVKLLDAHGREMPHALLDLALPSASGRRITVLMDPGRVKTGVGPNIDAGRALREGTTVSLSVAGPAGPVVKTWRVAAAVSRPLEPEAWKLNTPRHGSQDLLIVELGSAISSIGEALIAVVDERGKRVEGVASLIAGDATWRFRPSRPWSAGPHRLVTHPELEDPAGNRRCAAFEELIRTAAVCEGASLAFKPRGAS